MRKDVIIHFLNYENISVILQICELYEKLFTKAKSDPNSDEQKWQQTWVDPLMKTLCSSKRITKSHVIEVRLLD